MKKNIAWPVICFSQGIMEICSGLDDWGESNMRRVTSGWYNKMEFIDSTGNVFFVKKIMTVPKINIFNRLLFSVINKKLKVRIIHFKLKSHISLVEFKTLICKKIDEQKKHGNDCSPGCNTAELKNKIFRSSNFKDIMILLL